MKKQLNVRVEEEILDSFKQACRNEGLKENFVVEVLISAYLHGKVQIKTKQEKNNAKIFKFPVDKVNG